MDLLECFDDQVGRAGADEDAISSGDNWAAVLWVPPGDVELRDDRGRGLYRATVLKRAEIARERGYRWLFVDALPTSRPILDRIGFTQLTTTTPYGFTRDPAAPSSD